jgi:hypothetical protein
MKIRNLLIIAILLLAGSNAVAQNYKSFKVSIYTRAYEVEKMKDLHWLDSTWNIISSQVKVDKVYLETHRDRLIVPDETLEQAKQFFHERGIETGGGITYTIDERNSFETFCYSDPEHRKFVQQIAEHTARHFDDFILDDFFFTSCKSDIEIAAKGDRTWTTYRDSIMADAGENLVVKPAKKVNPKVKIIIKYPNWYDHFQGLGFDLSQGPKIFDGIWSGTETRNPDSDQHLQPYLGYNIVRYFNHIAPGRNYGGWVDRGGIHLGMDRYAEQLWVTMFAKAPEIALFAYHEQMGTPLTEELKTPYQGQGTSFDWAKMVERNRKNGVKTPTISSGAGITLETIDRFVYKLGTPIGIKNYKPYNSLGEDFLQNYLGMIGLPMDMYPDFPTGQKVVLLTEQAAKDPDIIKKIHTQLQKGGDVVVTSGFVKAIPDAVASIAEIRVSDLKALVNDFGGTVINRDILIPQVKYQTNDAWEIVSAGRPLQGGVSGYPMLLRAGYSQGNLYVMTIPEDYGNLYDLPESVLNVWRMVLSQDLPVRIEAPAQVSLFCYDNGHFIVESFLDEPVTITVLAKEGTGEPVDIVNTIRIQKSDKPRNFNWKTAKMEGKVSAFEVTLPPHSYRVFEMKNQ